MGTSAACGLLSVPRCALFIEGGTCYMESRLYKHMIQDADGLTMSKPPQLL